MRFLSKGLAKTVGFVVGIGFFIGVLLWAGLFTTNEAARFTNNAASYGGTGTALGVGGLIVYFKSLGAGLHLSQAEQSGTDEVPKVGGAKPATPKASQAPAKKS